MFSTNKQLQGLDGERQNMDLMALKIERKTRRKKNTTNSNDRGSEILSPVLVIDAIQIKRARPNIVD